MKDTAQVGQLHICNKFWRKTSTLWNPSTFGDHDLARICDPWRWYKASCFCEGLQKEWVWTNKKARITNTPMPKCLHASREVLTPLNNTVLEPVGARRASWSRVSVSPPALRIRSLAAWVNRRAATVIFGTVVRRISSVTVPTWTITFEPRSVVLAVSFAIRERERLGRLVLERQRRWRMTFLRKIK